MARTSSAAKSTGPKKSTATKGKTAAPKSGATKKPANDKARTAATPGRKPAATNLTKKTQAAKPTAQKATNKPAAKTTKSQSTKPQAAKAKPQALKTKASRPQTGRPQSGKSLSDKALLRKLFLDSVKDIYYAEKLLAKTLPKLRKAATTEELRMAFEDHLAVTLTQIQRLEQVFAELGEAARGKRCPAMDGLTEEGLSIIEDTPTGTATRDVGLIMAAQKVEHYEIASYGSLSQLARTMGEANIASILDSILTEEKETDALLTEIAENNINYEAEEEGRDQGLAA